MSSSAVQDASKNIIEWDKSTKSSPVRPQAAAIFGSLTFSEQVQRQRLPKDVFKALRATVTQGTGLDSNAANVIASALKDWALEHGATHYTHWFQPLTNSTAEKHDSFYGPTGDGNAIADPSPVGA